jgi:hypothetical protein
LLFGADGAWIARRRPAGVATDAQLLSVKRSHKKPKPDEYATREPASLADIYLQIPTLAETLAHWFVPASLACLFS